MPPTEASYAPSRLEADDQYQATARFDGVLMVAQLHQVLLAVQSPEPAEEHQHDKSAAKTRQGDPLTRRVRQRKLRGAVADIKGHAGVIYPAA
jgi:hypothetical protein